MRVLIDEIKHLERRTTLIPDDELTEREARMAVIIAITHLKRFIRPTLELQLSVRASNVLRLCRLPRIIDLIDIGQEAVIRLSNSGIKVRQEVRQQVAEQFQIALPNWEEKKPRG